jgi:DeoR family transcriptional regulator, fructose operon transcriptional repressor
MFSVTEITARRDLDELSKRGIAVRIHGGAIINDNDILTESSFEVRNKQALSAKKAIAKLALNYIKNGQNIFIDSGTTTYLLSNIIGNENKITVFTNTVNVATELNSRTNVDVVSIGGELRKATYSASGYFAENMIKQMKFDVAFISVSGIGYNGDLYVFNVVEMGVKKAIMQAAKKVIILCDSSKIGIEEYLSFGNLKEIKTLITDVNAPKNLQQIFKDFQLEILIADDKAEESKNGK